MQRNNRIVVDLNKVQWASFWYQNQYGDTTTHKHKYPSYRYVELAPDAKHVCGENAIQWLKERQMLDVWTPNIKFKLTANESLVYTGDKAKSLWKAWNEKIFKKK